MSNRTQETMTLTTLPVAASELAREPRDVRDARSPRYESRSDRADRSDRSNDFAGELAAAREAAREPVRIEPRDEEPELTVEDAGELNEGAEADEASAATYRVSRDPGAIDPRLAAAVDRIIARMREEYGHTVTMVEGARTPERQAALFAQGRSTPGPVVTWTMASKHITGNAADLMVDGDWNNTQAYARLQRVAAEEGLKVLGMRDPGHVELPEAGSKPLSSTVAGSKPEGMTALGTRAGALAEAASTARVLASPTRMAEVAAVARVAEPAAVARPAQVAQVATVAAPGVSAAYLQQRGAGGGGTGAETGSRGGGSNPGRQPASVAAPLIVDSGGEQTNLAAFGAEGRLAASQLSEAGNARLVTGAEPLERIAQVEQVKEAAGPRTPTTLTLKVDNGMGGEDRIRLDMRGTTVGATMNVSDRALAERLNASVQELRQALERRGLNAERLHARVPGAELIDASRVTAAALDRDAARFSSSQHTPGRPHDENAARDHRGSQGRDPQDLPNDQQRRQQRQRK